MTLWFIFWLVLISLAVIDLKTHRISLIIVIPGILAGIWKTFDIYSIAFALLIGVTAYFCKLLKSGDIFLLMFLASFLGMKSIVVLLMSFGCIYLYRWAAKDDKILPFTPFTLAGSLIYFIFR